MESAQTPYECFWMQKGCPDSWWYKMYGHMASDASQKDENIEKFIQSHRAKLISKSFDHHGWGFRSNESEKNQS